MGIVACKSGFRLNYLCEKKVFEPLLESGLNPYCEFEGKTVVDLIDEFRDYSVYKKEKMHLTTLCEKYKRDPIDPNVVMYWRKLKSLTIPLTIDDIRAKLLLTHLT